MQSRPAAALLSVAALTRLSRLAPLGGQEIALLQGAARNAQRHRSHLELVSEGQRNCRTNIVLSGWLCRTRLFLDGRRQILGLLLPGDLFGFARHADAVAPTSILTLSEAVIMPAPFAEADGAFPALATAYDRSSAFHELYQYRHIARLGRLSAQERMADWLLEIEERLCAAGLAGQDHFPMPLTQEAMADILGLTSVHVNRTLQSMRREELIDLRAGTARILDRQRLVGLVGYRPLRIGHGPLESGPSLAC